MSCSITLETLATQIYEELGSPDNISVPSVVAWLSASTNLGKMGALLDGCWSVDCDTNEISPALNVQEGAIYAKLFEVSYVSRLISNNTGASAIVSVKEGNTTIVRKTIDD